ncbi:MAG: THUMP domain-containing protein [archaeon]|jgi:adenylyl- and sulfurtransferase ThiI|nr:THUMP domain-containing protein [archaeon]
MVVAIPDKSNCLLVKTSAEIALKSNQVRQFFTKKLISNIKHSLKNNKVEIEKITRGGGRLYIYAPDLKKVAKVLETVIGIHAIAPAFKGTFKEYADIEKEVLSQAKHFLKKGDLFALKVKRLAETGLSSKDYENKLGKAVMDKIPGLTVKLKNPEKRISVEVRKRDFYIYFSDVSCIRGLPLGVEGNLSFLFEGKPEELLAASLLMFRGCNIFPVVKKKSKKIETHVNKLRPLNCWRDFVFTELKDFKTLVADRQIQAIGLADTKTSKKDLEAYKEFDAKQPVTVLRPLLLYPKPMVSEKKTLLLNN